MATELMEDSSSLLVALVLIPFEAVVCERLGAGEMPLGEAALLLELGDDILVYALRCGSEKIGGCKKLNSDNVIDSLSCCCASFDHNKVLVRQRDYQLFTIHSALKDA